MAHGVLEFIIMVGAGIFIGWITNVIAIRLLFRPHREIKILNFKIQGVIPKRKKQLAESIARTIDEELVSIKDITGKINSMELNEEVDKIVAKIVDVKLKEELLAKMPMLGMFLNESMMGKIKDYIKSVIYENKDELIKIVVEKLEENIDFKKIISEKIENFSLLQLERMILNIAARELKEIEIMGGILGGIVGVFQFILTRVVLK